MEELRLSRTTVLVPEFAVKDLPLGRTLVERVIKREEREREIRRQGEREIIKERKKNIAFKPFETLLHSISIILKIY